MPDFGDYTLTPVGHDPFAGQPSPFDRAPPTFADSPFASSGTLSSYEPNAADRLRVDAGEGMKALGASRASAENFGTGLANVVSNSPLGVGMSIHDAGRDFGQGDYRGAALNAGASVLAIFAGPMSRTADLVALDIAKGMAAKGAEREAIRDATGWFTGADGKWRYEISDHAASLAPRGMADIDAGKTGLLPDVLEHKALYDAYPQLNYTQVSAIPENMRARTAGDMLGHSEMRLDPGGEDVFRTSLHETQHGVQDIEGFGKGASVSQSPLALTPDLERAWANLKAIKGEAADIVRADPNYLSNPRYQAIQGVVERTLPDFEAQARYEGYRRLMGETEARNVESRAWLTPSERSSLSPKLTQDYPDEMQLRPRGPGGAASSASEPEPGIIAYHGSPHSFDKFDLSKIGTGEGNQAYGHGLYFAENEGIAKNYRDQLSGINQLTAGNTANGIDIASRLSAMFRDDGSSFDHPSGRNIEKIANSISVKNYDDPSGSGAKISEFKDGSKFINFGDYWDVTSTPLEGHMYQVKIAANPEHFLDWDKPLSEQSQHVRDNLSFPVDESGRVELPNGERATPDKWKGESLWSAVTEGFRGDHDKAAEGFRTSGIPGIKYLDAGSRGYANVKVEPVDPSEFMHHPGEREWRVTNRANQSSTYFRDEKSANAYASNLGSRNYVVFDDKIIDILKKYAIPALMATGAAHYILTPVEGDPFKQNTI
jgi:hypothetical protein